MANQLNFTDELSGGNQRPQRIQEADRDIIQTGAKQILFGTDDRDNVEVWMYNPDGTIAGHAIVRPVDTALSLVTLIDNAGSVETLNVNLASIAQRLALDPGRYSMVMNFFRDEVGSEKGFKFFISDISPDRLQVTLTPVITTPEVVKAVYEFVEPSVPKIFSKGLLDEIFGKAIVAAPENLVFDHLKTSFDDLRIRMQYANVESLFDGTVDTLLKRTYKKALEALVEDAKNYNVQRVEIENYIFTALDEVIYAMVSAGEIDPRFKLS